MKRGGIFNSFSFGEDLDGIYMFERLKLIGLLYEKISYRLCVLSIYCWVWVVENVDITWKK